MLLCHGSFTAVVLQLRTILVYISGSLLAFSMCCTCYFSCSVSVFFALIVDQKCGCKERVDAHTYALSLLLNSLNLCKVGCISFSILRCSTHVLCETSCGKKKTCMPACLCVFMCRVAYEYMLITCFFVWMYAHKRKPKSLAWTLSWAGQQPGL